MKHMGFLDGVRGYAIISVMIYHFTVAFQYKPDLTMFDLVFAKLFQTGWLGVDLFFVMSGFLITTILYKSADNKNFFKNFYVRRILRIFPLYYVVLAVMLLVLPWLSDSFNEKSKLMQDNSFWFWSYLVNWRVAYLGDFDEIQGGYMWSLSLEEQFYLFWPVVVYLYKDNLVKICIITIITSFALKVLLFTCNIQPTSIYVMTSSHLDGLLFGAAFSVLYINNGINNKIINYFKIITVIALLVNGLIFYTQGKFIFDSEYVALFGVTASSIIFVFLLYKLVYAHHNSVLKKMCSYPPIMHFGKLCYGLYLLHQPVGVFVSLAIINEDSFTLIGSRLPAMIITILISLFISFMLAYLSFHFFEKHFLILKKYFN